MVLIPGTRLLYGGGKEGKIYLLDRKSMGHIAPNDAQTAQSFQATLPHAHIHGAPVYWNGPGGARVYVQGENDVVRAFRFDGARFETTPFMKGGVVAPPGMPGGILSLSANGAQDGILWAMHNARDNDSGESIVEGIVRAYDARDLHELWNSAMSPGDQVGLYGKFCPPMVAGGKLFVATFSDRLQVYGLR